MILDASKRVGDPWRQRWDSLRLYSPAAYDGLPGMRFPARRASFPTTHEMGDYLEAYATHFELPVRTSTAADSLSKRETATWSEQASKRSRRTTSSLRRV